jgi:DNA mismatch endonuclease (patch repair protein)
MSKIRSRNTRLDKAMRKLLRKADIPFKMYPKIVGNPDFLVCGKIAIFCDSSFWHGRNWKKLKAQLEQGSNASYWVDHISRNRQRDQEVNDALRRLGYRVLRFWDDQVFERPSTCISSIKRVLTIRRRTHLDCG